MNELPTAIPTESIKDILTHIPNPASGIVPYELISLAMRYVFLGIMLLCVLLAIGMELSSRRRARKTAREHAYDVGELIAVAGSGDIRTGDRFPLPRDAILGRSRRCDILLHTGDVRAMHARAELRTGGVMFSALGSAPLSRPGGGVTRELLVSDGETLCLGGLRLRLELYAEESEEADSDIADTPPEISFDYEEPPKQTDPYDSEVVLPLRREPELPPDDSERSAK